MMIIKVDVGNGSARIQSRGRQTLTQLRAGQKLRSAASEVEVIVVRSPSTDVELACGGVPMVLVGTEPSAEAQIDPSLGEGPQLGKRYAEEDLGLELLCTSSGDGALTVDGRLLGLKQTRALPASD